jgi:hypothetical protein
VTPSYANYLAVLLRYATDFSTCTSGRRFRKKKKGLAHGCSVTGCGDALLGRFVVAMDRAAFLLTCGRCTAAHVPPLHFADGVLFAYARGSLGECYYASFFKNDNKCQFVFFVAAINNLKHAQIRTYLCVCASPLFSPYCFKVFLLNDSSLLKTTAPIRSLLVIS